MGINFKNKTGVSVSILAIVIVLIGFFYILPVKIKNKNVVPARLINHSVYSNYDFTPNDSVIKIGVQPMYLPTGIIFEAIKRDRILKNNLALLGKKIQYYAFLKGEDVNYYLEQYLIDGGVGGDMPVLSAASAIDVVIPAVIQKGNISTVSGKTMLTNNLKGKRIAFPYGSIAHYFILDLLQSDGINQKSVELIPMDITLMADALKDKKIDLFSAWEPNVASALKQYPDFFITYKRISTGYLYFTEKFSRQNPILVNEIIAAVIRAISWIKEDRENLIKACEWNLNEMEKLTGEKNILNADELATLSMQDIFGYYSMHEIVIKKEDTITGSSLCKEFNFLKTMQITKTNKQWEQIAGSFNNKIITNVFKHPDKFQLHHYDYE